MATTYQMSTSDQLQHIFITGLKNAHALEKQALAIMEPQVSRIEHYPEVADMLRRHIDETHGQISRLDEILDGFRESASGLKDAALSFAGSLGAVGHSLAGDEILKNSFANYAFENFEIASYTSLITLAEDGGFGAAIAPLQMTLREEQTMADWVLNALPVITRRYVQLSAELGEREARA
jgi:ferritin-like metal-binding protein YciE